MKTLSFHHGGRHGDLIYAMWTVKDICKSLDAKAVMKLSPYHFPGWGESAIAQMKPFIDSQEYVDSVELYEIPQAFTLDHWISGTVSILIFMLQKDSTIH